MAWRTALLTACRKVRVRQWSSQMTLVVRDRLMSSICLWSCRPAPNDWHPGNGEAVFENRPFLLVASWPPKVGRPKQAIHLDQRNIQLSSQPARKRRFKRATGADNVDARKVRQIRRAHLVSRPFQRLVRISVWLDPFHSSVRISLMAINGKTELQVFSNSQPLVCSATETSFAIAIPLSLLVHVAINCGVCGVVFSSENRRIDATLKRNALK